MNNLKSQWNFALAMEVLQHRTVDSDLWIEAAKWLLLNGPSEMREMLLEAASLATSRHFPELKPTGFTVDGQPCYEVKAIADALGISEEEAGTKLAELQFSQEVQLLFPEAETNKIQ